MKPTKVTLQLADRSIKMPRGIVEDVLIKVGDFVYPIDFVILETQPLINLKGQIPVILGRPFLATTNALINCRNGSMRLNYGDLTVTLNIFNLDKQLINESDETFEVNMIEDFSEEEDLIEDEIEFDLGYFDQSFEEIFEDELMFVEEANELTQCRIHKSNKWYNPPPEPIIPEPSSLPSTIGPLELCVKPYHSTLVDYEFKPSFHIQLN